MAKILVIDDDKDARLGMTRSLNEVGHEARASGDPTEAIQVALSFEPDVLVADWVLKPDHTGLEVAVTLRAAHPDLGLVFITGRPFEEVDAEARHLRPYRIVNKPCEFYELLEAVQSVGKRSRKPAAFS
jgi:DNA-binding response OmpR family regulator